VKINRWGDELYTDKTPIIAQKENAKAVVNLLDVAYWPEGSALCLFYGPTPISKSKNEILPYSPVNVVGKIISKDNILDSIKRSYHLLFIICNKQYICCKVWTENQLDLSMALS
jgi:uncharacterized protein